MTLAAQPKEDKNMPDKGDNILGQAIFEIIENQIRDGTPPETKQTLDRLMSQGHTRNEAMRPIGSVVSSEIFDILKKRQPYNEERYVAALSALPKLPWADEE